MANINPVDIAYFDSFASELMGRFQRLRHLVQNNTASGGYHEQILATVLKNFLTKRYSVKTGFIYTDKDNVSNQIDIIVVDENAPAAYVFQEGDFAIVMPEAVVAVIEVKTTLNAQEYDKSLKNIASAKRLIEYSNKCVGIVFGYQSVLDVKPQNRMREAKLNRWLQRASAADVLKDDPNNQLGPDAIIWLSDNYSAAKFNMDTKTIGDSIDYRGFNSVDGEVGWQLSILLAMVVSACEHRDFQKTRLFSVNQANRLLGMDVMNVSDDAYKLGSGKVI